jgi:hypothetical protein
VRSEAGDFNTMESPEPTHTEALPNPSAGETLRWSTLAKVLVAATFVVALVNYAVSEKIAAKGGLGWDGGSYGLWAADFHGEVLGGKLDSYQISRILPSGGIYYALGLLGVDRSVENIIHSFGTLNAASVALAVWVWVHIARHLGLGVPGLTLGYVGLFVNFFVLKWSAYYPVLTDMPAYLAGLLSVYFYLTRRRWALAIVTALSAFLWPTALIIGGLLLLFPREEASDTDAPSPHPILPVVLAAIPGLILLVQFVRLVRQGWIIPMDVEQPIRATLIPSLVITLTCAFAGIWTLLDCRKLFDVSYWTRRLRAPETYLIVAGLAAIRAFQYMLAGEITSPADEKFRLSFTIMTSVARPAAFLVADAVFYGPIILLIVVLWRPTCRLLQRHGVGLTLAAVMGVLLGLCSEPRSLVNTLALFVPFTVVAAEPLLRRATLTWFVILALISSKFWLTINTRPLTEDLSSYSRLFYSYGPYIPTPVYFLQAAIVLLTAGLFWFACRRPSAGVSRI